MRPALKIRYLLDFTARKFRNVVFKIRKVVIFKTNSFIAQYFKDISIIISILFTGKKDGPKLAKFHFCKQIQYPFSIHNSDRVAESLSKSSIFPTCSFLLELLKVYFNPDGTGKTSWKSQNSRSDWSRSSQSIAEENFQSRGICLWRHWGTQLDYETRTRYWIWVPESACYVIIILGHPQVFLALWPFFDK